MKNHETVIKCHEITTQMLVQLAALRGDIKDIDKDQFILDNAQTEHTRVSDVSGDSV